MDTTELEKLVRLYGVRPVLNSLAKIIAEQDGLLWEAEENVVATKEELKNCARILRDSMF